MNSLVLLILVISSVIELSNGNNTIDTTKTLNSKRTNELVDQAFLEQKDTLLDMLESKLKEVQNKKRKKADRSDTIVESKCGSSPQNGELKLKANGISAVGEIETHLKFGDSGKGTLKLNASGISNVGKSHLEMGVEDGNVHIPGIGDLFIGNVLSSNDKPTSHDTVDNRRHKQPNDTHVKDVNSTATPTDAKDSGDIFVNVNERKINVTAANENAV